MKDKRYIIHLLWIVLLILTLIIAVAPETRAQTPNQAGLVIHFSDGSTLTRCVPFDEPQITGYDLLRRSGLAVVFGFDGGMGAVVCKIQQEGCPANDCLCAYPPTFWSYWLMTESQWRFSPIGANGRQVRNGDVDGWAWGAGTATGGTAPPAISFDQICAAGPVPTAAPTSALPSPTSPATATLPPLPTDTSTPSPAATPVPTDTPPVTQSSRTLEVASQTPTATSTVSSTPTPAPTVTPQPPTVSPTLPPPEATPTETREPVVVVQQERQEPAIPAADPETAPSQDSTDYVIFGVLVVGLGGVLVGWQFLQRRGT
jgi:hypothetical protein